MKLEPYNGHFEYDYIEALIIHDQAAYGLSEDIRTAESYDVLRVDLLSAMMTDNPEIALILEEFIDGYGVPGHLREHFEDGFAVTYMAIKYQAEIFDTSLPYISEYTSQGFIVNLANCPQGSTQYCHDIQNATQKFNPELVKLWKDFLKICPDMDSEAQYEFMVGGIMAHEIVKEQINITEFSNLDMQVLN